MKKIYYEKKGRRYVPVAEYDNEYLDSFPKGNHLVMCYPGGSSRRFCIDPAYAPMIAAGRVAKDAICDALRKASEIQPAVKALTLEQQEAWEHLIKVFGDDARCLHRASSHDIAEAGLEAMQAEAEKLMQNASVRQAYEQFLLICKITSSKVE